MRSIILLLAIAGVAACHSEPPSSGPAADTRATPAALTYDGAQAGGDRTAMLAHGKRVGTILGCLDCHGANLQGRNMTEGDPAFGEINSSNVTLTLADYDDAEALAFLRSGVPADKREMTFMPSESFQFASDEDLNAVIAYARSLPKGGQPAPPHKPGPALKGMRDAGVYTHSAEQVGRYRDKPPVEAGAATARGRYIASTTCTECHQSDLSGFPDFSPDLSVAAAYDPGAFRRLMREGVAASKPDIGLMGATAKARFSAMTDKEIDDLHAYLVARAERLADKPAQ